MSLESLESYNERKRKEREEREKLMWLTGVACPQCGQELLWTYLPMPTFSNPLPTTAAAGCKACNAYFTLER